MRGQTDGFQLRELGFLHGRQVVLFEDLIVGGQSCNEIQEPLLVRHVNLIHASKDKVLIFADLVELLQQDIDCGRARTRQHLDFSILGAIGLSMQNIPHVLLRDHGGLVLGQVVSVSLHSLIQVSFVLNEAGEVIHRHLHVVVGFDHR